MNDLYFAQTPSNISAKSASASWRSHVGAPLDSLNGRVNDLDLADASDAFSSFVCISSALVPSRLNIVDGLRILVPMPDRIFLQDRICQRSLRASPLVPAEVRSFRLGSQPSGLVRWAWLLGAALLRWGHLSLFVSVELLLLPARGVGAGSVSEAGTSTVIAGSSASGALASLGQ